MISKLAYAYVSTESLAETEPFANKVYMLEVFSFFNVQAVKGKYRKQHSCQSLQKHKNSVSLFQNAKRVHSVQEQLFRKLSLAVIK
jgi:hypothetical protein